MEIDPSVATLSVRLLLFRTEGFPHQIETTPLPDKWEISSVAISKIDPIAEELSRLKPNILSAKNIIITSKHTVKLLFESYPSLIHSQSTYYFVVGDGTARYLSTFSIPNDRILIPQIHTGNGILDEFSARLSSENTIYAGSSETNSELIDKLQDLGVLCSKIYRPIPLKMGSIPIENYNFILISSGSIAYSLFSQFAGRFNKNVTFIAYGKQTEQVLKQFTDRFITARSAKPKDIISVIRSKNTV